MDNAQSVTGFSRLTDIINEDRTTATPAGSIVEINSNRNQQQQQQQQSNTNEVENRRGEEDESESVERNNCGDVWKQNNYYSTTEHPLQAAANALLNVAGDEHHHQSSTSHNNLYQQQQPATNGHHRRQQQQFEIKNEKVSTWNTKDDDIKSKLQTLINDNNNGPVPSFFRTPSTSINSQVVQQQQQQQNCSGSVSLSGFTINEVIKPSSSSSSSQRLPTAGSVKMEYPHHSDADAGGPTVVMSTSTGHHENVPMHPQHVEVIKTAGHVPPLHTNSSDHQQHHMNSKDDGQSVEVLQEMAKMRLPYDHYASTNGQRPGAIYSQVTSGVYDPLSSTTPNYSALANQQYTILQQPYNLLAPSQEIYYANISATDYGQMRFKPTQQMYALGETTDEVMERLTRQSQFNKPMTIEMPSPVDSGLGPEIMVTPKQEAHEGFGYDIHGAIVQTINQRNKEYSSPRTTSTDRNIVTNRESPVNIPKMYVTSLGFQYTLEAPNSTSVRKEDDRMTYINKGQFYSVTLDYVHDPLKPLKSATVKSILLLVFRDDKPYEEEIKCWSFWHSRQHSMKQRILDVDAKNSTGIVGNIEEVAHNAVQFYWNPAEQPAKVNIAVQCLSTDFSNQKGVKGFPLHLQVDTYDENHSKNVPFHRGYCQIKVFCDKGANRKMLHEQRRDEKRRVQGRKKSDGEYHELMERSEFYHMSNLMKPAVLFVPPEDYERPPFPSLETFYIEGMQPMHSSPTKEENGADSSSSPPAKRTKGSSSERVLIYVRKPEETVHTPLNLEPPTLDGLINALCKKFSLVKSRVTGLYKQCRKGITVKVDDDMVRYYANEDSFLLQFNRSEDSATYSMTLIEESTNNAENSSNCSSPT